MKAEFATDAFGKLKKKDFAMGFFKDLPALTILVLVISFFLAIEDPDEVRRFPTLLLCKAYICCSSRTIFTSCVVILLYCNPCCKQPRLRYFFVCSISHCINGVYRQMAHAPCWQLRCSLPCKCNKTPFFFPSPFFFFFFLFFSSFFLFLHPTCPSLDTRHNCIFIKKGQGRWQNADDGIHFPFQNSS